MKQDRVRLVVRKSNKYIYAQLLEPSGKTLATARGKNPEEVGANIGKKAEEKNVKSVVFDRGNHRYHGQVKLLAEAVRKAGLQV